MGTNPEQNSTSKTETIKAKVENHEQHNTPAELRDLLIDVNPLQQNPDKFLNLSQEAMLRAISGASTEDLLQKKEITIKFSFQDKSGKSTTNEDLEHAIGLRNIVPADPILGRVKIIRTNGEIQVGTRQGVKGNFYDDNGKYIAILDGDKAVFEPLADQAEFQKNKTERDQKLKNWTHHIKEPSLSEDEQKIILESCADTNVDPYLILALRKANPNYTSDNSWGFRAGIELSIKYLQSAQIRFKKENPHQNTEINGANTPEFLDYVLNHFNLFAENFGASPQTIQQVFQAYKNYHQLTEKTYDYKPSTVALEAAALLNTKIPISELFNVRPDQLVAPQTKKTARQNTLEKPQNTDSTWGLKGKELFNHPDFAARLKQVAATIGCSDRDLIAIFMMESAGNPQIQNAMGGATGLIQWMPSTAKSMYNMNTDQIRQMSGLQQLDLVEKYFGGRHLKSFSDLYRAVFFPAAIGKGPEYVFQVSQHKDKNGNLTGGLSAAIVAKYNPGIAKACARPDGFIDNAGFERYCAICYRRFA